MTKSRSKRRPLCQLYLVIEARAGEATVARLDAALKAAPIASVLFVPPAGEETEVGSYSGAQYADLLRPLITQAQDNDVAALLLNDANLVKSLKADGVHLDASNLTSNDAAALMDDTRALLLNNYIVGATSGSLRDDAMILGERGADYVGFSPVSFHETPEAALNDLLQRLSWWAEIFEIPCVAFDVPDAKTAHDVAQAGADFVALTVSADAAPAHTSEQVRAFAKAIALDPVAL